MKKTGKRSLPLPRGVGCTAGERLPVRSEATRHSPPPVFSAFRGAARRSLALWQDRGAHVFLLSGLLLVMGTVTLGGVFVSMNMSEGAAEREQHQNLMQVVSRLSAGFNESVREMVLLGDTDIGRFQDNVRDLEERVHGQAAKDGVYMSISLIESPDPSAWQTSGRCLSYDTDRSSNGVVIGYDLESKRETIVGALFDLHATDGRQVVHFPYYVKMYDCLPTNMKTWFTGIQVLDGFVLNPENAKSANDNNAVMTLGELPRGSLRVLDNMTMDPDTITYYGWKNERYIHYDDDRSAHHPATPLSDFLKFKMDTKEVPPDFPIETVRIRLDAWHVDATDDYLQVRALYEDQILNSWIVATEHELEKSFYYDLPIAPSGLPYWTHAELELLEVEFQVIEVDGFDPPSFFHVEYIDVSFEYVAPEKYAFEASFDWPVIPELYDTHHIGMRYKYDESTAGETFLVQILSNGTWETRVVLEPTAGGWTTIDYVVQEWEIEGGILEMRIVDSIGDDRWSKDGDTIEFDYIYLWSEMSVG